ncbi:MAG: ComEC/Rec2 family competence protein [Candidatus Methanomethylicia archaeon]
MFFIVFFLREYLVLKNNIVIVTEGMPDYVEGVLSFEVSKIRAGYLILENKDYCKAIINRTKIIEENKIFEGSEIVAFVKMKKIKIKNLDNWSFFDNADSNSFFVSNKIFYKIYQIDVIEVKNEKNWLRAFIFSKIDELSASAKIIKGVIFGVEDYSFYEKKQLIEAGIYHFFVASGSNILLAMSFFYYLFSFLRFGNLSLMLSVFFTFAYCVVIGFDAPLLRAFLFAIFVNAFLVYKPQSRLFFSVLSICIVWLFFLFYDFYSTIGLSFKLSFITFLGVIFLGGLVNDLLKNIRFPKIFEFVINNLTINVAVLVFSFPIFINYFGIFYLNGIFSGLIVAILIPLIFSLTFIYLLLPIYFLPILKVPIEFVFNFFVWIIDFLKSLNPVIFEVTLSKSFVVGYYSFLAIGGKFIETLKNKK